MTLHPDFKTKEFICELSTGTVVFEDNSHFPWIILVYKENVKNMLYLTTEERLELMKDIERCESVMNEVYCPFQTNIAMFGNKTPWLHVHIIARREDDFNFPNSPFSAEVLPYETEDKKAQINKIKEAFKR
jgi:diadenosine tetraphosphate (Ap4A) HIT family hydrolase